MSAIYDNWEKLVAAVLRKEELWQLFHQQSRSPSISSESSSFSFSFGLGSASLDDVPISFSSPEWPAVDQKESDNDSKPAASASILVKDQPPVQRLSTDKSVTFTPSRKRNLKIEVPERQIQRHWPDDENQRSYPLPLPPEATLKSSPLSQPNSVVALPSVPLPRPGRPEDVKSPGTSWKKGKLIGRGPLGHIYVGFNSEIGEMCVMKEVSLPFDDAKAQQTAMMIEKEMALIRTIKHPNLVQFYGTETVGNILYMYFEYVSAGSIYKILQQYGKFGESVIRNYTQQILSGLAYLHSEGIAHRDIKCTNILVNPNGRVKLCNYGVEKHVAGQLHPSLPMDSAYWTAPEVIRNPNACLSIDIWSLGCAVLEMATSKPALSLHDTVVGTFKVANHKELPKIPDYLSDEAKDFLRLCLQWNPVHRATASQLLGHPFVKPSSPLEKQIPVSTPWGHPAVTNDEGADHPRILHQLNPSPKSNFHSSDIYTPRNISSPVSPVASPLQHPRSPQQLKGTMSPPSHTTSSSSTLPSGGNGAIPYPHLNQSVLPKETFYNQPKHSRVNSPSYWDPNILRGLHSRSHEFPELAPSDNDAPGMQFGKGANRQPYQQSVLTYRVPQQLCRTPVKLNPFLI